MIYFVNKTRNFFIIFTFFFQNIERVELRGDFLQNRVLGAQNQSDARMRN